MRSTDVVTLRILAGDCTLKGSTERAFTAPGKKDQVAYK